MKSLHFHSKLKAKLLKRLFRQSLTRNVVHLCKKQLTSLDSGGSTLWIGGLYVRVCVCVADVYGKQASSNIINAKCHASLSWQQSLYLLCCARHVIAHTHTHTHVYILTKRRRRENRLCLISVNYATNFVLLIAGFR